MKYNPHRRGQRWRATRAPVRRPAKSPPPELVVITGVSGSGKGTVLKCLEDLGYYSVDNLPVELFPKFAELVRDSPDIRHAALVVDIREGAALKRFPGVTVRTPSARASPSCAASVGNAASSLRFAPWPAIPSTPPSSTSTSCAS